MQVLVINSGSSSIKFQVIQMPSSNVVCSGLVERIGLDNARIVYKVAEKKHEKTTGIPNHKVGLELIANYLLDSEIGVISSTSDIKAVGHRVVHGGSKFSKTVEVNDQVKQEIKELFDLAPLHNPANLEGILVAEEIFKTAKQVAVFDTAFHQTIPVEAYKYAIPNEFLKDHKIRLYGFHGTSHKYVTEQARAYLGAENSKRIISIHLGNGCSMTAVKEGKSIDHSLGFAPMNGLIMGTRCGDIDPSVVFYLIKSLGYSLEEANDLLNKKSGMYGLTGYSDNRDIQAAANSGDKSSQEALLMNAYRIKKFIGAYVSALNGVDAIIFTAGIGENSSETRSTACESMDFFGIKLDETKNAIRSDEIREIQAADSRVKILVIPTNEEAEIAKQAFELLS
ncbi:acetate/propionate family kinase [Aquimarina agarilytica]|uniref:acetate/propionate family kinase n=1 Tax=Aquimarina agarilytica TaxID=1087449 RepID=UPI00028A1254|nr:acetate kinase [Aquimarina agarilytica]